MASALRITTVEGVTATYTPAVALARGGGLDVGVGPTTSVRENGTESTQCDRVYFNGEATIATSTTTSYDMAGSLEQPDGTAFLPARLDVVAVKNTGTTKLYFGPHATAGVGAGELTKALGDLVVVHPGQTRVLRAGVNGAVVTATTADILAVENPSASVVGAYQIGIFGRSA